MSSHPTSFSVSLLYRLNPTGFMLRRSSMVKSKLLRFSAEDKTTGMWTNPKLMAPLHDETYLLCGPTLWLAVEADQTDRRIPGGDKEHSAPLTGIHHALSCPLASNSAFRFDAYRAIIGANLHTGPFLIPS